MQTWEMDNSKPAENVTAKVTEDQLVSSKREAYKSAPDFFKCSVDEDDLLYSRLLKGTNLSLQVECLHSVGVDIGWYISQLPGNVSVKNYHWLIDNRRKGPQLSPRTNRATIEDVELGRVTTIQVVAVFEADLSKIMESTADAVYQYKVSSAPVSVTYDKLALPPEDLCVGDIEPTSAELTWNTGTPKDHHVCGTSYRIMWWKTEAEDDDVYSIETKDCNVQLTNLDEETGYTVLVETRGSTLYKNSEGQDTLVDVSSASEPVTFVTARVCRPPPNFRAVNVTSEKIHLRWDPHPDSDGHKLLGLKVFVITEADGAPATIACQELLPDRVSSTIRNLTPETTYHLYMVPITKEYLLMHSRHSGEHHESSWIATSKGDKRFPHSSIKVTTQPSAQPTNLSCTKVTSSSVHLRWNFPERIRSNVVGFEAVCRSVFQIPSKRGGKLELGTKLLQTLECSPDNYTTVFQNLVPCTTYSFQIIAKSLLSGTTEEVTEVGSVPLEVRIPASVKPSSELLLTSYSPYHIDVRWWKPDLALPLPKPEGNPNCCQLMTLHLLAYQLFLDDKLHTMLAPHVTSTTLTCTPNQDFKVGLGCVVTSNKQLATEICQRWKKSHKRQSLLLKDICDYDVIKSRDLHLRLPQPTTGNVISVGAMFHGSDPESSQESQGTVGELRVDWRLPDLGKAEEQGILGYDVSWMCNKDGNENSFRISNNRSSCIIPVNHNSCVVDISVSVVKEEGVWEDLSSPSIQVSIPGPPDPPKLTCKSITDRHIHLEWSEPRLHGDTSVAGYQVYMNAKPVGKLLTPDTFQAIIPCQPLKMYQLNVAAVADDATGSHSKLQEPIVIQTPEADEKTVSSLFELIDNSDEGLANRSPFRKMRKSMKGTPETILGVVGRVTDTSVALSWKIPFPGSPAEVYQFRVSWSSLAKPKELDVLLKGDASQFTIRNCASGTTLFVVIYGLDIQGDTICRSQQITVQTNALISKPVMSIQQVDFDGCVLTWQKPEQFGEARITGYLLTINEQDKLSLPAEALTYTLRSGKMCHKYSFVLKALCCIDELSSKESDAVSITWPGVITPDLQRSPTTSVNSIGVKWKSPILTGGAVISKMKVLCMVDRYAPDISDSLLPESKNLSLNKATPFLNPHCQSVEFTCLAPRTKHLLYLDVYLEGLDRPIRSRQLVAEVARRPLTPKLRCVVPALTERKQLDAEACQLIQNQDRILQSLYDIDNHLNISLHYEIKDEILARKRLSHFASLTVVESKLRKCLERITEHTGTVNVHLSWDFAKDDGDATVGGYRVMVNDKPHGFVLHSNVTDTTIQLSAYNGKHRISLVAVTNHPVGHSDPSDTVLVDTTPFLPFTHRCLHGVHQTGSRFPNDGCCSYLETYKEEIAAQRMLVGCGRSTKPSRHIPPPSVMVYDVYHKTDSLLVPTKLSNKRPTLILFWNHWCLASQNVMAHFVRYAKERTAWLTSSAVCCYGRVPLESHHLDLAKMILSRGWKSGDAVRHTCCCQNVCDDGDSRTVHSPEIPDLFGVTSVPALVLVHPQGFLVWTGLLPATQQEDFNRSLDEKIKESCHKGHKSQTKTDDVEPPSRGRSRSAGLVLEETYSFLPRRQRYWPHHLQEDKLLTVNRRPYSSGGFRSGWGEKTSTIRRQRPRSSIQL